MRKATRPDLRETDGQREIRSDSIGTIASRADLIHNGFGLIGATAIVDDDTSAGGCECQSCGTANPARCAGDERCLGSERSHKAPQCHGLCPVVDG